MGRPLYYSPSMRRQLVRVLYFERKRLGIPMTRLVDEILTDALRGTDSWRMMEEPAKAISSHQFSVSIETELTGHQGVAGETAKLYATLQCSVDEQIQHTGFVPSDGYGQNGHIAPNCAAIWQCSDKLRELITRLIEEQRLDQAERISLSAEGLSRRALRRRAIPFGRSGITKTCHYKGALAVNPVRVAIHWNGDCGANLMHSVFNDR